MRRVRKVKRGRWLSLLVAAFIGYLLGGWHTAGSHSPDLSASQNVALRFPEADAEAGIVVAADEPTGTTSNAAFKQARLALLSPQPMAPVLAAVPSPPTPATETVASLPITEVAPIPRPVAAAVPQRTEARPAPIALPHAAPKPPSAAGADQHVSRSGFLLNDAQIASIRQRLHLSPDQERLWPAVEAALRNIAYAKSHYARHRSPAENTRVAALDADSAEVQGLKSAAIPLIMSFSDQQKNEVRSLAHVMGLDRLAAEF
jgi:hypothetical protein